MPYSIRKLPNQDLYRVYNKQTKVIHSYSTTLANAKKQVTLLNMVDAGVPLKKKGKGSAASIQRPTTPPIDYDEEVARAKLAKAEAEEQKAAKERDDAEEKRLKKKGKGTGASAQVRPEGNETLNPVNEEAARIASERIKNEEAQATRKYKKELKRLRIEASRAANEEALRKRFIENLISQEVTGDEIEGAGTNTSRQVAPEPTPEPTNEEAAAMRKRQRQIRQLAMSPAERQNQLRRDIFGAQARIKTLTGDRKEIFKKYNVPDKAALMRLRISSPEKLNDTELEEGLKEVIDITKQLADINERLVRYQAEITGGKVGAGISNPKLLELFKGTGSVGKQAKKMGFKVTSLDLDPIYTPDIETDILKWDYKKWATENKYVPDMIWSSPPCNTFSPMVYRLKERDVETAKPLSDRAKLGTKILYKTLEIIEYFLKKNPKLLFVVENPRGMMRKDAKMKKLERETTLYCLYGDFKKKPTDFWNNFPNGLNLNQETKQCPNKTTPVQSTKGVKNLNLDQRYSMPSKLIKHFLDEFKKQYSKSGGSIETDKFEENGIVSLPQFRSVKINLPTYMYKKLPDINGKPPPYKYKLVIPITSSRNLSSRKQETSLDINQKPVSKPNVVIAESEEQPNIDDFSPADKAKIEAYYAKVAENEDENPDEIDKDEYVIKPRGKPLPCNSTFKKSRAKESVKKPAPSVKAMVAAIEKPKPKSKTFTLTDEQLADLAVENEDAFDLYNADVEEFKKKYKGKYGKKYGFGVGKPVIQRSLRPTTPSYLGKVEQKNISGNSNMANKWITYVKEYASKNGMSYRDALRDPKCKAGYTKSGSVAMKSKKGTGIIDEMGGQALVAMSYNDSELGANAGRKFISL
jgi:hypothetical protein